MAMTRDDIIRMAREAGVITSLFVLDGKDSGYFYLFERFAAIVAAAEREMCAKEAELVARAIDDTNGTATYIAYAIRARSQ